MHLLAGFEQTVMNDRMEMLVNSEDKRTDTPATTATAATATQTPTTTKATPTAEMEATKKPLCRSTFASLPHCKMFLEQNHPNNSTRMFIQRAEKVQPKLVKLLRPYQPVEQPTSQGTKHISISVYRVCQKRWRIGPSKK